MGKRITFQRMSMILAACRCHYLGKQSVKQIAKSARRTESTIRRWLRAWPYR